MKLIEKIKCPICFSKNFTVLRRNRYRKKLNKKFIEKIYLSSSDISIVDQLVKCKKCELVYLNPRINTKLVVKSYKENRDHTFIKYNSSRERTFYNNTLKFLKTIKINNFKNKSVLDIGCGGGTFLKIVKKLGGVPYGIEPSKWLTKYIKKNYKFKVYPKTIEEFNLKKKFDIVSLWDVLEHVNDLNKSIKLINTKLKDNGFLIVNVPDYGSWQRKIFNYKWPFYLNVHLYYFDKKSIKKLMAKFNFELIYENKHYQILPLKYIIFRASKIFKFLKIFNLIVPEFLNFDIKYNIGQKLYVFKKKSFSK